MHFLAQIDLGALPAVVTAGDATLPLPTRPESGTLFLFAACGDDDALCEDVDAHTALRFHPHPVADRSPVAPPADLPPLGARALVANSSP